MGEGLLKSSQLLQGGAQVPVLPGWLTGKTTGGVHMLFCTFAT